MNYISYCRFSSNQSRENSIEDQHRINTQKLEELGIPKNRIALIEDKAIAGTHDQRPGYQRMMAAVKAGDVNIIVVDDQSRLTRAADIGMLLEQFRFHGVRFIAVADGVDTHLEGTEVNAQVKGLVNNLSNKSHGKRVRRGLAGRVLDANGSAGDHPYGYRSQWVDAAAAAVYNGHGPKPKRKQEVDPEEADVVRKVFEWFTTLSLSINGIARQLNAMKIPPGRRSKSTKGWSPARVTKMLTNRKYIGEWSWGEYQTLKLNGKRRNLKAAERDVVRSERPDLAIVSREVWDRAQARFKQFKQNANQQRGDGKRRLGINFRESPTSLLSGLLHCGGCGSRLHYTKSKTTAYFRCPVHARGGECGAKSVVVQQAGERAMLGFVKEKLTEANAWLDEVYEQTLAQVQARVDRTPEIRARLSERKAKLEKRVETLTGNLAEQISKSLQARLLACEEELENVDRELRALDQQSRQPTRLPTRDEVRKELEDLWPLFNEDPIRGALLLRRMIGRIRVFDVIFPGKKRGHAKLVFPFNASAWLTRVKGMPESATESDEPIEAEEVTLHTGEPTKLERLMPQVHDWVNQGVSWREIGKRTGMSTCATNMYYNRWRRALGPALDGDIVNGADGDVVNKSIEGEAETPGGTQSG